VTSLIKAAGLNKSFGQGEAVTRALKNIDLEILSGEMVSIMGPSGCGKTTLLQVLSGIERPDDGEVLFAGQIINQMKDGQLSALRLEKMGFVFQTYHLVPVLTAAENVELPLIAQGVSPKEVKRRAREALEKVGLLEKENKYPYQLSGGQNQRVALARAIIGNPKVLWADEPTGALDSDTGAQMTGLLTLINRTMGTTVVIVTHDPKIAAATSRTILMENGRIVQGGRTRA